MKKRKTKSKKKVIRKRKLVKKDSFKKISFLKKRKDINDKFFDLVDTHIKSQAYEDSEGETKWRKRGISKLAKELEISVSTLKKYINEGRIKENNDRLFINVERNFDKLKLKKTHETTKEYTIHNFTKSNFFPKHKFSKAKRNEQFYFRAGLYLVFEVKRKKKKPKEYAIQNFPISHYSNSYNKGYDEFFEIIQIKLQEHPSLKNFSFNYFDVTKIDVSK